MANALFWLFAFCYVSLAVICCWQRPVCTSLLLVLGLLFQLWFWREKADAVMMIAAALIGAPAEALCVKLGVWTYIAPTGLGLTSGTYTLSAQATDGVNFSILTISLTVL